MAAPTEPMVILHEGPTPTPWIELDRAVVTADRVRRFMRAAAPDDEPTTQSASAPLSFALALRRGHGPEVTLSHKAFAIHGGHDIVMHTDIAVGATYVVSGRVDRIFGKTGRTGPMTLVERTVHIRNQSGVVAAEITDRQVVRWKPEAGGERTTARRTEPHAPLHHHEDPATEDAPIGRLEIGEILGPFRRRGPRRLEISRWADSLRDRETLFHDREGSHALGYDDLVVPGPMQSAFVDYLLTTKLPDWRIARLSMTFRQSILAGEALDIEGVVVDAGSEDHTLDIVIRNAATGETASVGTAVLRER